MGEAKERLRTVIEYFDKTQAEFAESIGETPATLSRQLNGIHKIDKQVALSIQALYGIDHNWLLAGEGEMFLTPSHKNKDDKTGFTTIEGGAPPVTVENINRENIHQSDWFRSLSLNKQKAILLFLDIEDDKFFEEAMGFLNYQLFKEKQAKEEKEKFFKKGEAG